MGLLDKLLGKKPTSQQFNVTASSSANTNNNFSQEAWDAAVNAANQQFDRTFGMNSVPEILSIPVSQFFRMDGTFNGVTSCWNILNKKATVFKKAGRMDLAIACLRKLNEYMDASGAKYDVKYYLRLVEFLKQDRQFEEAKAEETKIYMRYPEIHQKLTHGALQDTLERAHHFKEDRIIFYTNSKCPQCSPYNNRIYTISDNNHNYPSLLAAPKFLKNNFCSVCGKAISSAVAFDFNLSPEIVQLNKQPVRDTRSEEDKATFEHNMQYDQYKAATKQEYDYLYEHLPELCPKSLSAYSRMKNSNSANFQKIVAAAKEKGFEIKI